MLTRPDAQSGRGRRVQPSPVAQVARELNLLTFTPERLTDPDFEESVHSLQPDCCPVIAFGGLIPQNLLDVPKHGWINLHFSLLPAWRGAAPVNYALLAGDTQTGATTFRIEAGLDTGPILKQRHLDIAARDTAGSLLSSLATIGAELLVETLDRLDEGTLIARPQPTTGITLAPRIHMDQAHIDWSASAVAIDRLVRAMTPAPGAWANVVNLDALTLDAVTLDRVNIAPVELDTGPADLAPGAIATSSKHVWVGTGDTPVRLTDVQPAGKRWMPASDWLRGWRGNTPTLR